MSGPVLVLGGHGFLGSSVCLALEKAGREFVRTTRTGIPPVDLLDREKLGLCLREHQPEAIVCAAGIASVAAADSNPDLCFRTNVTGVSNLVEAINREVPSAHLTLISSAAVYAPSGTPLTEDSPTAAGSIYGASKLAAEKIADWHAASGGPIAVLRCFNLIGPGQSREQAPGEFAEAAAAAGEESGKRAVVRVRSPEIRRDFTDVRDAGEAIARVAIDRLTGTFNLCSGRTLSLADLAGLFENLEIEASLEARGSDPDVVAGDPGRLHAATG